jgi:hypothetical protein
VSHSEQTAPKMFLTFVPRARVSPAALSEHQQSRRVYVSGLYGERGIDGWYIRVDGRADRAHREGFSFEEECEGVAHW